MVTAEVSGQSKIAAMAMAGRTRRIPVFRWPRARWRWAGL